MHAVGGDHQIGNLGVSVVEIDCPVRVDGSGHRVGDEFDAGVARGVHQRADQYLSQQGVAPGLAVAVDIDAVQRLSAV
ncbi:hypothetical protein EB73_31740 [Mycobacterium sp. SWH-M3]|nr:hypothetical protein EB73_31740 [Mycobacterium sp. SWH-M3]